MKPLATIILLMGFLQSFAQPSQLHTYNPIPRLGEEIQITFSLRKQDLTSLAEKDDMTQEERDILADNFIGSGSFKTNKVATDTGTVTIGPFSLTFGERTYHTGVLTLKVYPKLPSNIRQGMWMRYVEIGEHGYLITEQRVDTKPKTEKTSTGVSFSMGDAADVAYAELNKSKMEKLGLKIISSSTNTATDTVDKIGDEIFSGTVNYKRCTYTIEKQVNFKGPIELTKKLFDNFPDQVYTEDIVIR